MLFDEAMQGEAQDDCGYKGDNEVAGKSLRGGFVRQAGYHVCYFGAVIPAYGQDGAQLNNDFKCFCLFAGEVEQVGGDDEVAGAGDGEKFREAFEQAEYEGLQIQENIHLVFSLYKV